MKKSMKMKESIDKLYKFIDKTILSLEEELLSTWSKKVLTAKGNSVDTLDKLVSLITKLNKLNESDEESFDISQEDEKIIQRFLEKNK